jgi:hypothetical protein
MIEEWLDNSTRSACTNETLSESSSILHYGMVSPFINTTLKGWIWVSGHFK